MVDGRGWLGRTALHCVAYDGPIGAVRFLVEHGADVNLRDEDGFTPSGLASLRRRQEIVELLSEYGTESVEE